MRDPGLKAEEDVNNDYSGVRIAQTGQRFLIEQATVWNLTDKESQLCGQAAMFQEWLSVP